MPILEPRLNLSEQALTAAHELRGAMPLDEFLSFCVEFGVQDLRDQAQQQEREFLAQDIQARIARYQKSKTARSVKPAAEPEKNAA